MKYGIFGDPHKCLDDEVQKMVLDEFVPRGVEIVVCTGDIEFRQVNPELFKVPILDSSGQFRYLPVLCVLTKEQALKPEFTFAPAGWHFVKSSYQREAPGNFGDFSADARLKIQEYMDLYDQSRIFARLTAVPGDGVIYLGHERSDDFFMDFEKVRRFFYDINKIYDGVRLAITGHKHHQFLLKSNNLTWINPGAFEKAASWNSTNEFAIYDSVKDEAVFGRLSSAESRINPVSVGVLSDTFNINQLDMKFWERCRKSFDDRGVSHLILCGNFLPQDVGRPELNGLQVHYYLLPDVCQPYAVPANWHSISYDNPIVEIGGHRFYVQHGIGSEQGSLSEIQRSQAFSVLSEKYKHLDFIVAGLNPETIYMEGQSYSFIDPGDARKGRFGSICLPRNELTFGNIGF